MVRYTKLAHKGFVAFEVETAGFAAHGSRPDLGILASTLRGHKFRKKGDTIEKIDIFYLELEQALKRRSHYV